MRTQGWSVLTRPGGQPGTEEMRCNNLPANIKFQDGKIVGMPRTYCGDVGCCRSRDAGIAKMAIGGRKNEIKTINWLDVSNSRKENAKATEDVSTMD